jgi:3-methyladenine DNA glycosylase/8-oxoguanine DNA glycosylase|tara:strand:+ start:4916 stop:5116 length:201 start_codon:yes stop_codon:yes gene_type:complete
MGPFSEDRQYQRAESIKRLLDTNPQLDPVYKAMWQDKLKGLALNESTYNFRVKTIYSQMKKEPWVK